MWLVNAGPALRLAAGSYVMCLGSAVGAARSAAIALRSHSRGPLAGRIDKWTRAERGKLCRRPVAVVMIIISLF
jgi:hypothetical protein